MFIYKFRWDPITSFVLNKNNKVFFNEKYVYDYLEVV